MLTESFFNKSRFSVIPLTDQSVIAPDTEFTLITNIIDIIKFENPNSVTAVLQKVVGRDITVLPTVVTVADEYSFTATPALVDWDGKTTLQLKVTIDAVNTVIVPLVNKG